MEREKNRILQKLRNRFTITQEIEDMANRIHENIFSILSKQNLSPIEFERKYELYSNIRVGAIEKFYFDTHREYRKLRSYLATICRNSWQSDKHPTEVSIDDFINKYFAMESHKYRRENKIKSRSRLIDAEVMSFINSSCFTKLRSKLGNVNVFVYRYIDYIKQCKSCRETCFDFSQVESIDKSLADSQKSFIFKVVNRYIENSGDNYCEIEDDTWRSVFNRLIGYLEGICDSELMRIYVREYVVGHKTTEQISRRYGISRKDIDHLQQRVRYNATKFAISEENRDLYESWLGVDSSNNYGLLESEWRKFNDSLDDCDREIIALDRVRDNSKLEFKRVARRFGISESKCKVRHKNILKRTKKIREKTRCY